MEILGMDIGGTKCALTLIRRGGDVQIVRREVFETQSGGGPAGTIDLLCRAAERYIREGGKPRAVGISCGGPLDARTGRILSPPNLPGWDDVPIVDIVSGRLGLPAYLENDANACALAEWYFGAGKGLSDMVFLTMGTGMGAGIIAGGRLLRGASGMAGEVGHVRLAEDGPEGYGKQGSFEGFSSGGGIARMARAQTRSLVKRGRAPAWARDGLAPDEITARAMAEYADKGDADALALWAQAGDMLGRGIALLMDILNPEAVVIGSIFARCGHLLRPAMERAIEKEALPHTARACRILPAALGENVGDYAAAMAAIYGMEGKQNES